MNTHDLIRELREANQHQDRPAGGRRPGRAAAGTGRQDRAGDGPHAEPRRPGRATGVCGLSIPVLPGITPGSGPGHLGLFGYDPLEYRIGRGILEALGINFAVGARDVAVRGNFCTARTPTARSPTAAPAGRRPSAASAMCQKLQHDHRCPASRCSSSRCASTASCVVFRGDGLGDAVNDTDPQAVGVPPLTAKGGRRRPRRRRPTAVNRLRRRGGQGAEGRGADQRRDAARLRPLPEDRHAAEQVYGLKAAAIAVYPMYKGLARLVGMDVARRRLDAAATRSRRCERLWNDYDFFFLHYKYTDSTGEDGNFPAKVRDDRAARRGRSRRSGR